MTQHQLPGWDPLAGKVRQTLEQELATRVWATEGHRSRLGIWTWPYIRMRLSRYRFELVLGVITVGSSGAAIVVLASNWPWTTSSGTNYSGVVIGCATATALASVLLSLVAVPFRSATELAGGYSAEVLHRATPWLLAAIQVMAAAFLFVLAALNPTQRGAIGAGLLTAAGFVGVWLSAKAILVSSDPYLTATRYVAYLARARQLSRRAVLAQTRRMLRGGKRSPELVERPSAQSQNSIVGAFVQQLGEGMRNALSRGQSAAALTLWQGALDLFIAQAKDRRGAVGPYEGMTQGLLELAGEAIERTDAAQLYAAAVGDHGR